MSVHSPFVASQERRQQPKRWRSLWSLLLLCVGLVLASGCGDPVTPSENGNQDGGTCGGACQANEDCVGGQFCLPKCADTQARCGSKCIDIKTDKANCGKCDTACKDDETCTDGACKAPPKCGTDETDCSGTCANTKTDKANCGTCGTKCKDDETCADGTCQGAKKCGTDETDCGGLCVNTKTDKANCGKCGTKCGTDQACVDGACQCQGGLTDCNGTCIDTQSSDTHCGKCDNTCTSPQYCDVGKCTCAGGQTACASGCTNTKTDDENCGACDTKCQGGESCFEGVCKPKCTSPEEDCAGTCINTQSDDKNCGNCGNACQTGETCQSGTCVKGCATGETNCSGTCTNTNTDDKNCGKCGTACPSGEVCQAGVCKAGCQSGLSDCSGTCVNLQNDTNNCGTCGTTCVSGEVCSTGQCASGCQTSETNCSGTCTNTNTDKANCGTCGTACTGTQVCSGGTCGSSCGAGEIDCSGTCANTQTNNNHCGTCGTVCSGGESCNAGACTCPTGQKKCLGTCTDTNNDEQNCGNCGTLCTSTQACNSGTCQTPCPTGQTSCNGTCVNTNTDKANCGNCGTACTSTQVCSGGVCGTACSSGETSCSGTCTNTQSDDKNCGTCGTACAASESCTNGTCACPTGQSKCTGVCTNTSTDNKNCGTCGTTCTTSQACVSGACQSIWATVITGGSGAKFDDIVVNGKGNVYVTGDRPTTAAPQNFFLSQLNSAGVETDLSVNAIHHNGFLADLTVNQPFTTANVWHVVKNWRTSGLTGLHSVGGGFDATTGEFTAPANGYYLFNARLRFNDTNLPGSDIGALLAIDGNAEIQNGTYVRLTAPTRYEGLVTEGLFKLTKGQKVTVQIRSVLDDNFEIQNESGFSGFYIGPTLPHGFQADLNGTKSFSNNNWNQVKGFRAAGTSTLFANSGGFNATNGVYTAPIDGLYYFSARAHFRNANTTSPIPTTINGAKIEASIVINNDAPMAGGRYGRYLNNKNDSRTIQLSGIVRLAKGDQVTLQTLSTDNDHKIADETGFAGFLIGSSDSGFNASVVAKKAITTTGWVQLQGFRTSSTTPPISGLFNQGAHFDETTGEYTAPVDGYYHFSATSIAEDANNNNNQYLRVILAVDGNKDLNRGLHTIALCFGSQVSTLSFKINGTIYLDKGQKVSLWLYSNSDNNYSIGANSSFSGYYVKPKTPTIKGYALATNSNDNLFIAGHTLGTVNLGSSISTYENTAFVSKRKTDGTWEWTNTYASGSPTSLQLDSTGNLFLCGDFGSTWTYATGKSITTLNNDSYIAKLNSSGVPQWAVAITSPNDFSQSPKCAVAATGEIYITGAFTGKLTLGSITLNSTGATGTFRYIARVKADGSGFEWAKEFGTNTAINGIAANNTGNVYVNGSFSTALQIDTVSLASTKTEIFVLALDKTGKALWGQQTNFSGGSNYVPFGGGISIHNGNVYISGSIRAPRKFDATLLTSNGAYDAFFAALDSTGKWLWARSGGGTLNEYATRMAIDPSGNFYTAIRMSSPTATFGPLTATQKGDPSLVVTKNLP